MIILGVPYTEPELANVREIGGGWPYGAGTLAGPDGSRTPTDHELRIVRAQGRRVAEIAKLLKGGELIEDVLRGVSHDQG